MAKCTNVSDFIRAAETLKAAIADGTLSGEDKIVCFESDMTVEVNARPEGADPAGDEDVPVFWAEAMGPDQLIY